MNAIFTDSQLRKLAKYIADEIENRQKLLDDTIIGVEEASAILGYKKKTIYNKINEIPHHKVGGSIRFFKSELLSYVNN